MITFDVSVSGGEVGRKLQSDTEELAYALAELADGFTEDVAAETVSQLPYGSTDQVKAMLLLLMQEIEKPF